MKRLWRWLRCVFSRHLYICKYCGQVTDDSTRMCRDCFPF